MRFSGSVSKAAVGLAVSTGLCLAAARCASAPGASREAKPAKAGAGTPTLGLAKRPLSVQPMLAHGLVASSGDGVPKAAAASPKAGPPVASIEVRHSFRNALSRPLGEVARAPLPPAEGPLRDIE